MSDQFQSKQLVYVVERALTSNLNQFVNSATPSEVVAATHLAVRGAAPVPLQSSFIAWPSTVETTECKTKDIKDGVQVRFEKKAGVGRLSTPMSDLVSQGRSQCVRKSLLLFAGQTLQAVVDAEKPEDDSERYATISIRELIRDPKNGIVVGVRTVDQKVLSVNDLRRQKGDAILDLDAQ